jgi:phenylalanyl-tRNA synthetase beta chain
MKFSLDWLSDFADLGSVDVGELADTANEIGLEIGTVEKAAGDPGDTVLDADITPNRPDAMNHRGFARDVAAALGARFDAARIAESPGSSSEAIERRASVAIEVPDRCHRFAVRMIRGVAPATSSPRWLARMDALGLKTIDAAVDATNISLWGLGQPLHAFDADRVAGGRVVIRLARKGERLLCLDGVERELHPDDVVVADERRPLSLAGVIGGAESAITPGVTKNVLLEAAWWDPSSVRRTARRHGLHTDASHRYERGADIEAIPEGLALAARLILERAGGELLPGTIDAYPSPPPPRVVRLRGARLKNLSGLAEFSIERAAAILARLGFAVERAGDELAATVPSWRPDVSIEEDLIEEVVRIHGYSKIPPALPAADRLAPLYLPTERGGGDTPRATEELAADAAREAGFSEAMNFPFVAPEESARFGNLLEKGGFRARPLEVANPLDATRPEMRRTLLAGLLESASRNHRAGRRSIALFEIGRVWDRDALAGADPAGLESRHFAAILGGQAPGAFPARPFDVGDVKGMVGRILRSVTGDEPAFSSAAHPGFVAGTGMDVAVAGRKVGTAGRFSAALCGTLPVPDGLIGVEIDLGQLPRASERRFREFSRFPAAEVDLTVACGPGATWGMIESMVSSARLAHLEDFALLKIYVDAERPDVRHVTLRLTFRAADRTLSQEEVNRERDRLFEALKQEFGVEP